MPHSPENYTVVEPHPDEIRLWIDNQLLDFPDGQWFGVECELLQSDSTDSLVEATLGCIEDFPALRSRLVVWDDRLVRTYGPAISATSGEVAPPSGTARWSEHMGLTWLDGAAGPAVRVGVCGTRVVFAFAHQVIDGASALGILERWGSRLRALRTGEVVTTVPPIRESAQNGLSIGMSRPGDADCESPSVTAEDVLRRASRETILRASEAALERVTRSTGLILTLEELAREVGSALMLTNESMWFETPVRSRVRSEHVIGQRTGVFGVKAWKSSDHDTVDRRATQLSYNRLMPAGERVKAMHHENLDRPLAPVLVIDSDWAAVEREKLRRVGLHWLADHVDEDRDLCLRLSLRSKRFTVGGRLLPLPGAMTSLQYGG